MCKRVPLRHPVPPGDPSRCKLGSPRRAATFAWGALVLAARTTFAIPGTLCAQQPAPSVPATPSIATVPADDSSPVAVIEGRVVRVDGRPVQGASVGVFASGDSTATSDSGTFVLRTLTSGTHIVWVHGVGFEPTQMAVKLSTGQSRSVTITVMPAKHVLAPVVTTARFPAGYVDIGLDKRMLAGIGQFLDVDQIDNRHATELADLLQGFRGILIQRPGPSGAIVKATRGASCWSIFVDGLPQSTLGGRATRVPIPQMDAAEIGAIEVYEQSERPAGFQMGSQFCGVIAVWTRTRLGLDERDTATADSAKNDR